MLLRVARNTAAQGLSVLVQFADRFLVVGILLRAWGPQVYSEWVVLVACVGLLSLGELGLNIYYGNVMQRAWATGNAQRFQRTIATALTCSFGVALLLGGFGLVVLAAIDVPTLVSVNVLPHAEAVTILMLMGAATLSRIARGSISQSFRGRQEYALGVLVDVAFSATVLSLTIAIGLLGYGPLAMAAVYLTSDLLVGWGFMLWALHRRYPDLVIAPKVPSRAELHDVAQHAGWLSVQQGAPVAWQQVPVVLLGFLGTAGPSLVSFVVLRTLVNFIRTLGTMLSIGNGVEIAAVHHAGRTDAASRHMQMVGYGLSILTMAMAAGIVLFGPSLVAIWTGRNDLFNPVIVLSLLASTVLAAPMAPISAHLVFGNAQRPVSIALLAQLILGLTACAVLARTYGAAGAAIGLAIGEAVAQVVVLPILAAGRLDGLSLPRYFLHCVLAMVLTAGWSGLMGTAITALVGTSTWPGLFAAGALWTLLGLIPPLIMAVPAHQREALAQQLRWRTIGRSRTA